MEISINESYTEKSLNTFLNTEIFKFKSQKFRFESLGYGEEVRKEVKLNNGLDYAIKTDLTILELNKFVKNGFNTIQKINENLKQMEA